MEIALPLRSYSSHAMSSIVTWHSSNSDSLWRECSLYLGSTSIILLSAIESVVYSSIALIASLFYGEHALTTQKYCRLAFSCRTVVQWVFVYSKINQPYHSQCSDETFFKVFLAVHHGCSISLFLDESTYLKSFYIQLGYQSILEHVVKGAKEIEAFQDVMFEKAPYFLAKLVYIFTFGSHKNKPIPLFFKTKTIIKISKLRTENASSSLHQCFSSLSAFEEITSSNPTDTHIQKLREMGSEEIQGSFLIRVIWPLAQKLLSPTTSCSIA